MLRLVPPMQMGLNSFFFSWRLCMCVQSFSAPIFQLINFIFTHLFLNGVSDGNAWGCSSEVLTWQMGLWGEAWRCQSQGFNSERSFFLFVLLFMEGRIIRKLSESGFCLCSWLNVGQLGASDKQTLGFISMVASVRRVFSCTTSNKFTLFDANLHPGHVDMIAFVNKMFFPLKCPSPPPTSELDKRESSHQIKSQSRMWNKKI